MNIHEFLTQVKARFCTQDDCLVSLQVGNRASLQGLSDNELRLVIVDDQFRGVQFTPDELAAPGELIDKIANLLDHAIDHADT